VQKGSWKSQKAFSGFELTVKFSAILTGSDRWKDAPSGLRVTVSGSFFSTGFGAGLGTSTCGAGWGAGSGFLTTGFGAGLGAALGFGWGAALGFGWGAAVGFGWGAAVGFG
jgi:hypothetical protein